MRHQWKPPQEATPEESQFCFTFIGKSSPSSNSLMLITWAWYYFTQNFQLQKKQNYSRSPHPLIPLVSLTKEWLMNQGPEFFPMLFLYFYFFHVGLISEQLLVIGTEFYGRSQEAGFVLRWSHEYCYLALQAAGPPIQFVAKGKILTIMCRFWQVRK